MIRTSIITVVARITITVAPAGMCIDRRRFGRGPRTGGRRIEVDIRRTGWWCNDRDRCLLGHNNCAGVRNA